MSVNKAILVGNLGRDPEIRYSGQGTAVVNFSIATTESWFDKNTNQKQEHTEWHRIVVFGKMAEHCEKYLSKGRQVYVEGKLKTSSYDKDGQTHYSTSVIASTVDFLGGKDKQPSNNYEHNSNMDNRYQQNRNQADQYQGRQREHQEPPEDD